LQFQSPWMAANPEVRRKMNAAKERELGLG
jgi:hypothetical protein